MADRRYALIGHTHSGTTALNDLSDVTAPSPTTGDLLRWNGSAWVNYPDSNYAAASHTHTVSDITDIASNYAALSHTHLEADITDLGTYMTDLVNDTTPQLGGNLDTNGFHFSAGISLQVATPALFWRETDAAADEGVYRLRVAAGTLTWATLNDAESSAVNFLTVARTGTAVTAFSLVNIDNVDVKDGANFTVYDTADTNYIRLRANTTDGIIESNQHIYLNPGAAHAVYVYDSGYDVPFRVYDSGGTDYIELKHNSTNSIVRPVGGELVLQNDADQSIFITQQRNATGNTSGAQVADHEGTYRDVGFNIMPRSAHANSSYTIDADECGKYWDKTGSTGYTVTLEASTSTDFPVYGIMTLMNKFTSGNITVTEGTGTTLYYLDGSTRTDTAGGCTIGPGGVATLQRAAAGTYYIWGSGITP